MGVRFAVCIAIYLCLQYSLQSVMRILIDDNPAKYQIISATEEYIQINDQKLVSPFILSATQLSTWDGVSTVEQLSPDDFKFIESLNPLPEILLLGTGPTLKIPPDSLLRSIFKQGIGVEFMDTRSACHTYSILSSEGRNIIACFFLK